MNNEVSILFYIFSFVISSLLYYLYNRKNKKLLLILSFIILLVIGGFRENVGTDYLVYSIMYTHPENSNLGFQIICSISKILGGVRWMFFIYEFLTLLFFYLGIKNIDKKYRFLSFFCFLFLYYVSSFNIMKQLLAISIVFYALKYISKRNIFKWTLYIFIATIFHQSAFVVYILYFIFNTQINKIKYLLTMIVIFISLSYTKILFYLGKISLFSKFLVYTNEYTKTEISNKMFFVELIILFVVMLYSKKLIKNDKNNSIYLYIYLIGVIFLSTGFFNPFVKRISSYFLVSKIILLPQIPYVMTSQKNKLLCYLLIMIYVVVFFIISYYILGHSNIIPYNFSFN